MSSRQKYACTVPLPLTGQLLVCKPWAHPTEDANVTIESKRASPCKLVPATLQAAVPQLRRDERLKTLYIGVPFQFWTNYQKDESIACVAPPSCKFAFLAC